MMSHFFLLARRGAWVLFGGLMFLWSAVPARAAAPEDVAADLQNASEIHIQIQDRSQLRQLTRLVSIDDVRGTEVRATATPAQLRALKSAGYTWKVVPATAKADVVMCPDGWVEDDDRSWSCYPSYEQFVAIMSGFASLYPDLCRLVDLGPTTNTVRPHRLLAVLISDSPQLEEDEPEVFLTSSIHGDETAGFIVTLRLIHHLLDSYGTEGDIRDLVDSTEIWISPLGNPDGTYRGGDDTVAGAIRYYTTSTGTNSGVDGNRNFPDPTGDEHPDGRASWRETEAMMALAASETFVLSASFHGGAEVVNYPWDTWQRRHPDDAWFEDLSRDYADLAQDDSPAGYLTDLDNGITNGYDWYQTFGSRQDWITYFHGGREVTIELSETKLLPSDELESMWQWNRRALLDFLGHAHHGIRGLVTDQHGRPRAATVEVLGVDHEADGSMVRTDPDVGDYHRLLLPGLYDLEFRADGCVSHRVAGVAVSDGGSTRVDASMWCDPIRRPSRRIAP